MKQWPSNCYPPQGYKQIPWLEGTGIRRDPLNPSGRVNGKVGTDSEDLCQLREEQRTKHRHETEEGFPKTQQKFLPVRRITVFRRIAR